MYDGYLTDVLGIKVGHAEDLDGGTGLSIVIPPDGNTAAVEVRGSAPGTRETDLLDPINVVESVNAIILSGGSAYGLIAADAVMRALEEDGKGLDVGVGIVPIVPQAVLFDLAYKDYKARPDEAMARLAYKNASTNENRQGIVGAGAGATVGKILGMDKITKSGLGSATVRAGEIIVSAMVAVNAFGDIYDIETSKQIAGPIVDGKMVKTTDVMGQIMNDFSGLSGTNTTIGIVATNASFDKTKLKKIAQMTHDGFARAINPVHTMFDGDTIFSLATNEIEADINQVGVMAAEAMAKAIANAIYFAKD